MWNFILQLGSIAGLFSIAGGAYLYFENKKFKKLDAERELEIARIELAELRKERGDVKTTDIFFEYWGRDKEYDFQEAKVQARISYYSDLRDHRFLWFLNRKKNNKKAGALRTSDKNY